MNKKIYLSIFLASIVQFGFSQELPEPLKAGNIVKVQLINEKTGVYKIKSIKGKWVNFEDTAGGSSRDIGWWNTDQILLIQAVVLSADAQDANTQQAPIRRQVIPLSNGESTRQTAENLKRPTVNIGESFSIKIDAKENCLGIDDGKFNPLKSEIPNGTYLVTLKSDMFYHETAIPIKKILFWIVTLHDPKGFFWAIAEGEEIKVVVKNGGMGSNLIYAFLVDSTTYDNTGSSELSCKRVS